MRRGYILCAGLKVVSVSNGRLCRLFVLLEEVGEDWDSYGGFLRNYVDERRNLSRIRVDIEYWRAPSYVLNKSRRGVDLQSGADNDENVGIGS